MTLLFFLSPLHFCFLLISSSSLLISFSFLLLVLSFHPNLSVLTPFSCLLFLFLFFFHYLLLSLSWMLSWWIQALHWEYWERDGNTPWILCTMLIHIHTFLFLFFPMLLFSSPSPIISSYSFLVFFNDK